MRLLDFSYHEPAYNLALDEVLLEGCAAGKAPSTLRFWESPVPFVVIGSSQRIREVVDTYECACRDIPILRRCSAGGAVIQGPGCLNYALTLSFDEYSEAADLQGSYAFILNRVASALATLGITAERQGCSDLAVGGHKCSGNAQRRKRNACLHHGTILYACDHALMDACLPEPDDRPEYRGNRLHNDFVKALPLLPEEVRHALSKLWQPDISSPSPDPDEQLAVTRLVNEKYACQSWNWRR